MVDLGQSGGDAQAKTRAAPGDEGNAIAALEE
jgi:hypothetical protein